MGDHLIDIMAERYPQLALPVSKGMSKSELYRDAVLRGQPVLEKPLFICPDQITLESVRTPAGSVEVLFFQEREDFLHAYRALGYRCEPAEIPDSVGACIIDGLADWGKINDHKKKYEAEGAEDWEREFRGFTAVRTNYCSVLILLSGGYYSAVLPETACLPREEWIQKSILIRKYHELCHFVCRKLWPEKKDALRDEVYADCIGLIAAFGFYDSMLARTFLGIEKELRPTGRILYYVGKDLEGACSLARAMICALSEKLEQVDLNLGLWQILAQIY